VSGVVLLWLLLFLCFFFFFDVVPVDEVSEPEPWEALVELPEPEPEPEPELPWLPLWPLVLPLPLLWLALPPLLPLWPLPDPLPDPPLPPDCAMAMAPQKRIVHTNFESFDIKLLLVLVSDACGKRLTSYLVEMAQGGVCDSDYWRENLGFHRGDTGGGENSRARNLTTDSRWWHWYRRRWLATRLSYRCLCGSGADPSGPIWLLMKAQPNVRTSRDDNSLGQRYSRNRLNNGRLRYGKSVYDRGSGKQGTLPRVNTGSTIWKSEDRSAKDPKAKTQRLEAKG
jgi:hypothetical protein